MPKVGMDKLVLLMERLRSKDGCPWDREQTLKTLVPFIIEEAYEVVSAIESGSIEEVRDELGDLLFQVVFASRIAEEEGRFSLRDVIEHSYEKMVRRHPHVFADKEAGTPEEVLRQWAQIKEIEKKGKKDSSSVLANVPEGMPALLRAHKITQKAARVGFDWKHVDQVLAKVEEELSEFRGALQSNDATAIEDELGDILFSLVNLSRFVEVNPESALRKTIGKFIARFHHMEKKIESDGKRIDEMGLAELDALWEDAKSLEKKG